MVLVVGRIKDLMLGKSMCVCVFVQLEESASFPRKSVSAEKELFIAWNLGTRLLFRTL